MATTVPEFISVLRDIRDNKYPQISTWYTSISDMNSNIESIEQNVISIQEDVNKKNTSLKSISVLSPVTTVPNKPNGDAGNADVIYNPVTNQFEFKIPVGKQGQSMRIDYTVDLIVDKYSLTVNTGDIVFVVENSSNYVKLNTGANAGASDWSSAIPIVPAQTFTELSDTPSDYVDQAGKVSVVSSAEDGLVFKTGAELGIIGYNYVKNPLFENTTLAMTVISNVAFGSDKRGYGTFTTVVGTPTLASDHVRVSEGVTIANASVYTSGKSAIGVRFKLDALTANSTIVNCGNFRLFLNGSSLFAVTDGTTTNSLTTGMIPNTTDEYEVYATDQDLIVLNTTTGVLKSSSLSLTIATQTSGSIILGGNNAVIKYYAISIQDKSTYTQVDGAYEEFSTDWKKSTTDGEMSILPDIEGAEKGMRFVASALPTISKIRMSCGNGGQFSGKTITFSFTAYSSGVGANSITANFVTDRGSQITSSRLITQNIETIILDNGIEKNYSVTFDVDAILPTVFIDSDAEDYIEFTLPSSANYWINIKKPKFEINSLQTEFISQGASTNKSISGGATGGGNDTIFILNSQTVTTNYSIPSGQNAGSFGSITIADGVTVAIPDGSSWSIV